MDEVQLREELGRAYRALRGIYGKVANGETPDKTMIAYHSPTLAAAIRFVEEDAIDGAAYFIGKDVSVLHEALGRYHRPRDA